MAPPLLNRVRRVVAGDTRTWRSCVSIAAPPDRVLAALTDPAACARWSGVAFTVHGRCATRLVTGCTATVRGSLIGRSLDFDLEIFQADVDRLWLRAAGPLEMGADYALLAVDGGCRVDAEVSVRPVAVPLGPALATATALLLSAGALDAALARLAREAEDDTRPPGGLDVQPLRAVAG